MKSKKAKLKKEIEIILNNHFGEYLKAKDNKRKSVVGEIMKALATQRKEIRERFG